MKLACQCLPPLGNSPPIPSAPISLVIYEPSECSCHQWRKKQACPCCIDLGAWGKTFQWETALPSRDMAAVLFLQLIAACFKAQGALKWQRLAVISQCPPAFKEYIIGFSGSAHCSAFVKNISLMSFSFFCECVRWRLLEDQGSKNP